MSTHPFTTVRVTSSPSVARLIVFRGSGRHRNFNSLAAHDLRQVPGRQRVRRRGYLGLEKSVSRGASSFCVLITLCVTLCRLRITLCIRISNLRRLRITLCRELVSTL